MFFEYMAQDRSLQSCLVNNVPRGRMQYKSGPRLQIRAVGAFEHRGCLTVSRICSVLGCDIFGDGYASCFLLRTKSIRSARRRTDRSVQDVIGNENHHKVIILVHVFSNGVLLRVHIFTPRLAKQRHGNQSQVLVERCLPLA